ncbi:MAG: Deoxycytidine monophosphate (dCMP) deaminase [Peltula sp. TS41687]|nr:MAG: Deoxycytidine monophosphate (dCMP) deaminase [Peltula sp. TS41687]
MFIGICGTLCSGKKTVADILATDYGFKKLRWTPLPIQVKEAVAQNDPHLGQILVEAGLDEGYPFAEPDGDPSEYTFVSIESLVNFVTKRWKQNWVTTNLYGLHEIELLLRRPFFTLLSVDAPILKRFERFNVVMEARFHLGYRLETFVEVSDAHLFQSGGAALINRAGLRLNNSGSSLSRLRTAIAVLDLPNELQRRIRPEWDQYFMGLASLAAQRSNCMKRRVGCVLVRDRRVISTGYNGTPRHMKNCLEGGCTRCNLGETSLSTCLCLHAEENALLEAGRERIRENTILYCDTCPCLTCSIKIVQVGISEVVYNQSYSMDAKAAAILTEGGVKLRQFSLVRRVP